VKETGYVLEHRRPGGVWYRSQKLGSDPKEAKAELARKRALAIASDAVMVYRVVRETREVLAW
jgi:hypothetical protein